MAIIDDHVLKVLKNCTTNGKVVLLPSGQLDRKLYQSVAKQLELIGGKWKGGKTMGFVFELNPTDLLAEICEGESRNLKKEFQFFGTPPKLADRLVSLADIKQGMSCLEPSAGQFAICESIFRAFPQQRPVATDRPCVTVDYYELMPVNQSIITNKLSQNEIWRARTHYQGADFLKGNPSVRYDRIIANPPFSNNQDIDHIYQMYQFCKKGGRIVTMASKHWQLSSNRKETIFRDWIHYEGFNVIEVNAGEFKESGTNIATCILIIDK